MQNLTSMLRQSPRGRCEDQYIDITMPVHDSMTTWPGQPHVSVSRFQDIHKGDESNITVFSMSVHSGTHVDAPKHYFRKGMDISHLPLEAVLGPAKVIEIHDEYVIRPEELEQHNICAGDRILFKTRNSDCEWTTKTFKKDYVHLTTEGAQYLAQKNIRSVGADYICIGGRNNQKIVHSTLIEANIWIIEGLWMCEANEGVYELICLPLKIIGADGAPARAVLKRI